MFRQSRVLALSMGALSCGIAPNYVRADIKQYSATVLYSFGPNGTLDAAANGASAGSINAQATLWNPNGAAVTLNPKIFDDNGITTTEGLATDGTQLVGAGGNGTTIYAIYWNPSTGAAVNLNPGGAYESRAFDVAGNEEVGFAGSYIQGQYQINAILWTGSSGSAVSLTPRQVGGIYAAGAAGTDGTHQVGQVQQLEGGEVSTFAAMWSGSAASFVSLNPINLAYLKGPSEASAVDGGQEVGNAWVTANSQVPQHPLLWIGDNSNAIDLLPTGFDDGVANGTNGFQQVGFTAKIASIASDATVWSGSADSAVNLQAFLPSTLISSIAYSIDGAGNVFGVADDASNNLYMIEWSPVPEPGSLSLMAVGCCGLISRRRR